ncbi:PKD domain-containing protein [Isoptericola cucumis]|uniref:PKD domain-containing protein n=1 Tax=Isoptericola cucumis TaxID=1776856 RepID=A0ABQ2B4T6_9MICO|nr:PKD domain-containing protein [Isoptericola cucumis]GGI07801.1 hypothetical protein GCM10007368_17980 [Isoptericola cucumis]
MLEGSSSNPGKESAPSKWVYWRATPEMCELLGLTGSAETQFAAACARPEARVGYDGIECENDQFAMEALFRAERDPETGELGPATIAGDEQCVSPADLAEAAAREFASLKIRPSPLHVQPPDGWTLINVDTITYTEDTPQEFDTTLLGVPVTLRAVPAEYSWDYDDGTRPLVTDTPGAPYPNHTVAHTYSAPGTATITLDTTWAGQFRIAGTATWTDVPGAATTETSTDEITIHEARTRLVEDPVDE